MEDGKWVDGGEDWGSDLNDARKVFTGKAIIQMNWVPIIKNLKAVSTDTASFVKYLKNNGKPPKEFIINALATHKIVVYGDLHRRKMSWALLKETINDPKFVKNAGTVFLELSSDKQDDLNRFFSNEKLDSEIILNIFQSVEIDGWYDRGEYEFIIDLWKRNKGLPNNKKINVVAVDIPRPYNSLNNKKEYEAHFANVLDRNEQMAKIISETVKSKKDLRNSLFIVGYLHAYKSLVPGYASAPLGKEKEAKLSAVAQLANIFSGTEVFTIFPHCPIINNSGTIFGLIRNGLFDAIFAEVGNNPIGFKLKDSPFGKEPFDGFFEITYNKLSGSFEHNYDGYIFLEPLENEQKECLLYEIITDKYMEELQRRAKMTNSTVEEWFGVEKATKEAIISKLKESCENKKSWTGIY